MQSIDISRINLEWFIVAYYYDDLVGTNCNNWAVIIIKELYRGIKRHNIELDTTAISLSLSGGVRGIVVARWTAGQYVEWSILHQGHVS